MTSAHAYRKIAVSSQGTVFVLLDIISGFVTEHAFGVVRSDGHITSKFRYVWVSIVSEEVILLGI
jgi:hypothetical protein